MNQKKITPEEYTPDTSAARARLARMENKKGDIPGIEEPQRRGPSHLVPLRGLSGDKDNEGWLRGGRPRPTPMLLTLHRPGQRGADKLGHIGALPRGKVALFVSPGGVGKTGLLCQLALAVATGTKWLETFDVSGGAARVLLALGEEDHAEIMLRLWDAADALGIRKDEQLLERAEQNLRVLPLYGHDATILTQREEMREGARAEEWPPSDEHVPRERRPCPSDAAQHWMEQMRDAGEHALIIFDPLSRFLSGDENDNKVATQHITILEQFTKLPGNPTVLCAHHTNKGALAKDATTSQASARGASAFVDGARWMAVLTRRDALNGSPRLALTVEKTNYTAPIDEMHLIRDGGAWRPCKEGKGEMADLKKLKGHTAPAQNADKVTGATMEFDHD